jgi:predicted outer membrane repeat protein
LARTSIVSNNTARYNGGGIVADQIEMSMLEPGSILFYNEALGIGGNGGFGGGLYIFGGTRSSYAYIGSGTSGTRCHLRQQRLSMVAAFL